MIEYPEFIKFELENEKQHEIMLAVHQSIENNTINIDKFLFWIIGNFNVEQSIFLNKFNKIKKEIK